jgi:hypothetical protein
LANITADVTVVIFTVPNEAPPHIIRGKHKRITYNQQQSLSSRNSNIETLWIAQEAHAMLDIKGN